MKSKKPKKEKISIADVILKSDLDDNLKDKYQDLRAQQKQERQELLANKKLEEFDRQSIYESFLNAKPNSDEEIQLRNELVLMHQNFIKGIANKFLNIPMAITKEDLIQEGNNALIDFLTNKKHKLLKDKDLIAYTKFVINEKIVKLLLNSYPVAMFDEVHNLNQKHYLEQKRKKEIGESIDKEISHENDNIDFNKEDNLQYEEVESLGIKFSKVIQTHKEDEKRKKLNVSFVNTEFYNQEDNTYYENPDIQEHYQSDFPRADIVMKKELLKEKITKILKDVLSKKELKVITLNFGLKDENPISLEEISKKMGLTLHNITQCKSIALKKLREVPYFKNKINKKKGEIQ